MLKGLPNPKSVWKYMLAVTQIPRGSNDEGENFRHKKILSFLKEQAEALHCETYVDKGENLIIRKAAYPGRELSVTLMDRFGDEAHRLSAVSHGYGWSRRMMM